ncbi:hypothetical protein BLSTO_00257d [Blastocystis sp. subtype 1]
MTLRMTNCLSNVQSFKKSLVEQHIENCLLKNSEAGTRVKSQQAAEADIPSTPSPIKRECPSSLSSLTPQKASLPESLTTGSAKNSQRQVRNDRRPLAERLRPTTFDDVVGNHDLFGAGAVLRTLLEKDSPPSIILFGPPGCGKTTVASIIMRHTHCPSRSLSCCTAGVQEIRAVAEKAEKEFRQTGQATVLFMDEIHRFNKKQQDIFLPYIESGVLVLIGATTENPSFSINSVSAMWEHHSQALLSRCRVVSLSGLGKEEIVRVLKRAMGQDPFLQASQVGISKEGDGKAVVGEEMLEKMAGCADGDARTALNLLDACCSVAMMKEDKKVTEAMVEQALQQRFVRYDKNGEEHYNVASALQKSIRGSDVQAALYWLGRMIEGGEDPL